MAKKNLPTIEMLHKLLVCDAEAGKLYWRKRTPDMFVDGKRKASHVCSIWNIRYAGKEAFTSNNKGYRYGTVFNGPVSAHRIIWVMVHGEWPDQIDHINHNRSDNRIGNLRDVSIAENNKNRTMVKHNKSGATGVYWKKKNNKWAASISVNGTVKHIGLFRCITAAAFAHKMAAIKYGFNLNHGKPPLIYDTDF